MHNDLLLNVMKHVYEFFHRSDHDEGLGLFVQFLVKMCVMLE
jgi:hypothetical protein